MSDGYLRTYLNVHGTMDCTDDGLSFTTVVFMTLFDRFGLPISPVNVIFENSHGEDVVQSSARVVITAENNAWITAIQIGNGDVVFARIRPEKFVRFIGNSQSVGPTCLRNEEQLITKRSNQ